MTHPFVNEEAKAIIKRVQELRHDVPEYKRGDTESKDLINAYHNAITLQVTRLQEVMGFGTFGDALHFVDLELKKHGADYAA